jgi:hypothetical protein
VAAKPWFFNTVSYYGNFYICSITRNCNASTVLMCCDDLYDVLLDKSRLYRMATDQWIRLGVGRNMSEEDLNLRYLQLQGILQKAH